MSQPKQESNLGGFPQITPEIIGDILNENYETHIALQMVPKEQKKLSNETQQKMESFNSTMCEYGAQAHEEVKQTRFGRWTISITESTCIIGGIGAGSYEFITHFPKTITGYSHLHEAVPQMIESARTRITEILGGRPISPNESVALLGLVFGLLCVARLASVINTSQIDKIRERYEVRAEQSINKSLGISFPH